MLAIEELGLRPRDLARYLAVTDGAVSHALKRGRSIRSSELYQRLASELPALAKERPPGNRNT